MLNMVITLNKEGTVQAWRARVAPNPSKPHMRANFLESAGNFCPFIKVGMGFRWSMNAWINISDVVEYDAGVDPLDITTILIQGGGGTIYPLPRIIDLLVHPKLNLTSLLFAVNLNFKLPQCNCLLF